jgi:hypothetical protein
VQIRSSREFETANITFGYSGNITNESSVAPLTYDEEAGNYRVPEYTVNKENNTVTVQTEHFSPFWLIDLVAFASSLSNKEVSDNTVLFNWYQDFSLLNRPVDFTGYRDDSNLEGWRCRNDPYGGRFQRTAVKGTCIVDNGEMTDVEETNRRRYLEKKIDLPDKPNVGIEAKLKASISDSWSNAGLYFIPENSDERVEIFNLENDWDYTPDSTNGWITVNKSLEEYRGESGVLSVQADGRWNYRFIDTQSEIDIDYYDIGPVDAEEDGCNPDDGSRNDGDDLPYCMEKGDTTLLGIGSGNFLDPDSKYSDGDSLPDGEEVTERWTPLNSDLAEELAEVDAPAVDIPDSASEVMNQKHAGYRWSSLPNDSNTDGVGFDDGEDRAPRTEQILTVGLDIPTVAKISSSDNKIDNANEVSLITTGEAEGLSDISRCVEPPVYEDIPGCQSSDISRFEQDLILSHDDQAEIGALDCLFGCTWPDGWNEGSELNGRPDQGHTYLLVKAVVNIGARGFSDERLNKLADAEYRVTNEGDTRAGYKISQNENTLPKITQGTGTEEIKLVYKMREGTSPTDVGEDLLVEQFEHIGQVKFKVEEIPIADRRTSDNREEFYSKGYRYSVAISEVLTGASETVENAAEAYKEGISAANSITRFIGSGPRQIIVEYSRGEISPTNPQSVQANKISLFAEEISKYNKQPQGKVTEGDRGIVTPTGPVEVYVR